jgi:hypothetical protein
MAGSTPGMPGIHHITAIEIATDPPGFTVDEPPGELGTRLKLPAWLEPRRTHIEARLPELRLPAGRREPGGGGSVPVSPFRREES